MLNCAVRLPEDKVALVVDIRGGKFFDKLLQVLDEMEASGQKYELLFLDASDVALVRRYKETRRRHPLGEGKTLLENIVSERLLLDTLREKATYIIDTSNFTTTQVEDACHRTVWRRLCQKNVWK